MAARNKYFLSILLCTFPVLLFAKSNLSKLEKAIVKTLKKQYKLESVEIERPYNGLVYYELLTKDFKQMIADSTGQVIIPQSKKDSDAYPNNIRLIRQHNKGVDRFRERGRDGRTTAAYYPGNKSVFLAYKGIGGGSSEYQFFSTAGELLYQFTGSISEDANLPIYISKDLMGGLGLMALDGRTLLPNVYTSIETRADGICTLYQVQDGVERMGGACVSDLTHTNVPCIFNYVEYSQSNGCWMVQVHEYDSIQAYKADGQYDTSFLDEGQKFFEQQQYEDARKYYKLIGSEAKWAQFYIGATHYKTTEAIYQNIYDALAALENSSNRQDLHIASDIRNDLSMFNLEAAKAERAFRAYIEGGHTKYAAKTEEMLYELSEMQSRTSETENRVSMAVSDLERRCAELDRAEKEEYKRRLEQQRINIEQQRLREQRLAREQRDREIRMRQKADAERRQREARKREEEKRNTQQRMQQRQQQQQRSTPQAQQPQRKTLEQRNKELKGQTASPIVPKKKLEEKSKEEK